jgi:probable selenium-dependent hydroxylase accessory protein YqeC
MLIRPLGLEHARLISLIGAGGKTTLMFALAHEMAARGERVLLCTTTKLARSEGEGPWRSFAASGVDEVLAHARRRWAQSSPSVALCYCAPAADGAKLLGHPPEMIDRLKEASELDRVLVEADGSARRPLKAPAAHEPVVPPASDAVLVVAGLNGLGLPLAEENVLRASLWAALSTTRLGELVSAESFAQVAVHDAGLAKGCPAGARRTLFLNQADTTERHVLAERIVQMIGQAPCNPFDRIASGCLRPVSEIRAWDVTRSTP